jgi:phage shock protein A
MSKVISEQVKKAEALTSGLRKKPEIMASAGLNEQSIAALESECRLLNEQNQELEQIVEKSKSVSQTANKKLIEVRNRFQELKKKIKMSTDSSKWEQVGIFDKR